MLQLHRSCARGAQVSTALAPPIIPPPTVMPSYILPHPPSPLPHPAIWSFSQNHVHTARIFSPPSFPFMVQKQDEGPLSVLKLP